MFAEFDGDVGALAFHPDGRLLACTARGLAPSTRPAADSVLAEAEAKPLHA